MTVQQIKEQIKDINEGLAEFSPSEKEQFGAKLLAKKKELETELSKLESATKQVPKTKPTTPKATAQKVAKQKVVSKAKAKTSKVVAEAKSLLEKLRATKAQKSFNEGKTKNQLERDAKREALPIGKRISADGNTYYEYRSNRADVSTKRKPYLEKGGLIEFDEVLDKTTFSEGLKNSLKEDLVESGYKDFSELKGGNKKETQKNIEAKVNGFPSGKNTYLQAMKIAEVIHSTNTIELTEQESERLDYLQSKEDTDSLTKSENEEYEMLVEKYRETKDYKGYGKGGTIKEIDLPNSNLYLYGFGRDTNGNSNIKVSIGANKPFSIQINNPIFYKKTYDKRGYKLNELTKEDILGIEQEVVDYIKENGNKEQKLKLKTYSSFAIGGKISNKGAYQNEPENKETYTRYADSLDGEKAKPAGWRYTDAGAKRLKISNPKTYVTKEHLEKYRGKYFTDSKGVKHRYVYIERRADKSDIKRTFPYLEKGGEIDGFNLVIERWSKVMGGNGIDGTIRTYPQNYYVATIDEKGDMSFDDMESNTKHLDKSKVLEMYNKNEIPEKPKRMYEYAKGGSIPNNYKGKTAAEVWNEWSVEQREHFLEDHRAKNYEHKNAANPLLEYNQLNDSVKLILKQHIDEGQYEEGGEITNMDNAENALKCYVKPSKKEGKALYKQGEAVCVMYDDDTHEWVGENDILKMEDGEILAEIAEDNLQSHNINVFGYETQHFDYSEHAKEMFEEAILKVEYSESKKDALANAAKHLDSILLKAKERNEIGNSLVEKQDIKILVADIQLFSYNNYKSGLEISIDLISNICSEILEFEDEFVGEKVFEMGGEIFNTKQKVYTELRNLSKKVSEYDLDKGLKINEIANEFYNEMPNYESGGEIADSNNEMLQSQLKAVQHHAKELSSIINDNTPVEAWVVGKIERASTDLSDITHYLDGAKFEDGGQLNLDLKESGGEVYAKGGELSDKFEVGTPAVYHSLDYSDNPKEESGEIVIRDGIKGISLYPNRNYGGSSRNFIVPNWENVETFYEANERQQNDIPFVIKNIEMYAKGGEMSAISMNKKVKEYLKEKGIDKHTTVKYSKEKGLLVIDNLPTFYSADEIAKAVTPYYWEYVSKSTAKLGEHEMKEQGGKVKFADKVKAVKASLLKTKKVSPKVQKDYGKTYSPKEAEQAAKRIVGSRTAKWKERISNNK